MNKIFRMIVKILSNFVLFSNKIIYIFYNDISN